MNLRLRTATSADRADLLAILGRPEVAASLFPDGSLGPWRYVDEGLRQPGRELCLAGKPRSAGDACPAPPGAYGPWRGAVPDTAAAEEAGDTAPGLLIGGGRLEPDGFSYFVRPDLWRRGFGLAIARSLLLLRQELCPGTASVLSIRRGNLASIRIAEALGYRFAGVADDRAGTLLYLRPAPARDVEKSGRAKKRLDPRGVCP